MKPLLSILIVCIAVVGINAQKPVKDASPTPTPERNRAIVALLNDARLAAPEIGVDTFLKVAESNKINKDPEWRREILDEAWRMADEVKFPVRRTRAFHGTGIVDTVSGYMSHAFDLGFDSLSLRARVIKAWLRDDKFRARQLVFQIGGDLKLKPVRCEDAMGYQVADIYSAVGVVSKEAFTAKEIADGTRSLFLLPWIENIESPSQIVPVIDLLSAIQSPPVERQLLGGAFERAINRNFGDDRSFVKAFWQDSYKVYSFIRGADDPDTLTRAWRGFLAKNAAGPRCLDSKPKKGDLPWPIDSFNRMFPEDKRFSPDDFDSVEYKGIPDDKLYLNSEMYKKFDRLVKPAREKKNLSENLDNKAAQLEWQLKITDILELLDSWKATVDEPESEVFNMKALWFQSLIREVKEREVQVRVLRAYMRYLAASPMQKESFIEWSIRAGWAAENFPELFKELADEFPNANFRVMVAAKKVLAAEKEKSPVGPSPK